MQVALVDDDSEQLNELYNMIDQELTSIGDITHRITMYENGEQLLSDWKDGLFDLVVLDIYMCGQNGINIAYKIRETDKKVRIAFCTASNEFASESYEVGASHYLRKPITLSGVKKMISRLGLDEIEKNRSVKLSNGENIRLRRILYTEYDDHNINIHLKGGEQTRLRSSHTEMEALLLPFGFFYSPYKGIILNLYEAVAFDGMDFTMSNGQKLPVVRRKQKEAKEVYTTFIFNKMNKEID